MGRIIEFIKSLHDEALEWCRERTWYVRLPVLIWFAYILVNHLRDPMYNSLFGYLNLGIHELGHYVFLPFGKFLEIAGGSLLQCLAPVISIFIFRRQRDFFAIAFCFGWLSTSLFHVATYAADARAMALPLVTPGGGYVIHDWNYLLSRIGMLQWDTTLAFTFRVAATVSMLVFLAGGGYLIWRMIKPTQKLDPPIDYHSRIPPASPAN